MKVEINDLKPNPRNKEIYGDYDVSDLMESLPEHGLLQPILINQDKQIISGHRRYVAAKELGWDVIDAQEVTNNNVHEEIRMLILSNMYRPKSLETRIREGIVLEEAEKELAKLRQGAHAGGVGPVRDIVGQKIGVSGKTYENGKKVIEEIDKSRKNGDSKKAKELTDSLNKSVNSAISKIQKDEIPSEYWYWQYMASVIQSMENAYKKLSKRRNGTTPDNLGYAIGNIKQMAMRMKTWNPKKMADCSTCGGTGIDPETQDTCGKCINGKSGLFLENEY